MNAVVDERKLVTFLEESNAIEGIFRDPTSNEITELEIFLQLDKLQVADLIHLVDVFQPGAKLRIKKGMDVRVGNYVCPSGGAGILYTLEPLIIKINTRQFNPYDIHQEYLNLHPFMDGNGRSSRAIWLWQMTVDNFNLPFLQWHYYETLKRGSARTNK